MPEAAFKRPKAKVSINVGYNSENSSQREEPEKNKDEKEPSPNEAKNEPDSHVSKDDSEEDEDEM